ncbi:MAG: tyrosine-type recombinase/integrase [Bdellovibrionales bacterium]
MSRKLRTPWLDRERGQPNWYIYWYDQASGRVKRRSTGKSVRPEAEEELADFLLTRAKEQSHDQTKQRPERYKIATALRWYAQEKAGDLASASFAGRAIENFLNFFDEKATVSTITPQKIVDYEKWRKVNSSTVRRECVVLSAALNHAVKNGRLTSAPHFPKPKGNKPKDRYLTKEELHWLLKGCIEPHIKLFILLALNTGARKGAILDLKWPQVDMVNKLIYLNPPDREETNKKRPIVPINDRLYKTLQDARKKAEQEYKKAKEDRQKRIEAGKNAPPLHPPCAHVISYRNQPILNIKKGFRETCRRAEELHKEHLSRQAIEYPATYKQMKKEPLNLDGVTPHTLRHTAGTLMAQAGIDIFMIAKMLGHSVAKTTELYAHHKPDYLKDAANVLASFTTE